MKNLIILLFTALLVTSTLSLSFSETVQPEPGAPKSWEEYAHIISRQLNLALEQYKEGKLAEAKLAVLDAYFGSFESKSGMEEAIKSHISAARNSEIEGMFKTTRVSMAATPPNSANIEKATKEVQNLEKALQKSALKLKKDRVPLTAWNEKSEEKKE